MLLTRPFRSLQERIRGHKGIRQAVWDGDIELVQDHLLADPTKVSNME